MAWCLTAPSHYLTQCWCIITKVQWHSPEGGFKGSVRRINHRDLKAIHLKSLYTYSFLSKFLKLCWNSIAVSTNDSTLFSKCPARQKRSSHSLVYTLRWVLIVYIFQLLPHSEITDCSNGIYKHKVQREMKRVSGWTGITIENLSETDLSQVRVWVQCDNLYSRVTL